MNDTVGLAQEPEESLSGGGLDALPSAAVRMAPINNRLTFHQAIEDMPPYSFRLKPDRRRGSQAYAGYDRRQRR